MIPQDLYSFFTSPGGHSIVIRGAANTGKTTMALQIVEEIAELDEFLYVPTRTRDKSRFMQFPWLFEKEEMDRAFLAKEGVMRAYLQDHSDDSPDLDELVSLLRRSPAPQEIVNIYSRVEERLPQTTVVVIDRIDRLAERHRVDVGDLIETLHRDLSERMKAQVIMVQEQPKLKGLDAYTDGCITIKTFSAEDEAEFVGQLEISKLTGIEIAQNRYLYKLRGGRLVVLRGVQSY
jgi:KaiC/GvpD/RAD55 family RecA-like ATPase